MSDQSSELVEISKLNGDFRKNYGKLIGAFLYLRSVSAARGRSWFWAGLVSFACSAALAWLARYSWTIWTLALISRINSSKVSARTALTRSECRIRKPNGMDRFPRERVIPRNPGRLCWGGFNRRQPGALRISCGIGSPLRGMICASLRHYVAPTKRMTFQLH